MEDKELILDGVATCPFCGQLVAAVPEDEETPQEAAARVCDCYEAKKWRIRKERLEAANETLDATFGEESEERYGMKPVPEETLQLLRMLARMLVDNQIDNASIQCGDICKATLKVGGKGEIKIERSEGRKISMSV